MTLNPKFVVDENGRKTAFLLPVEEYDQLLEALEDQLDAAELEVAAREESELVPYDQVRNQLRSEGKL